MSGSKISLSNMVGSALSVTISNEVGFAGARFFGRHFGASTLAGAATKVSFKSMAGASLVGGAALYIPAFMLKQSLKHLGLMNDIANQAINIAFSCGSAALGAVLLGFAVKPFLICALVGCAIDLCWESAVKPFFLCALFACATAFCMKSLFWGERDENQLIFSSEPDLVFNF